MSGETVHPEVLWAQRSHEKDAAKNVVYLTIAAPDVPKEDLKLDLQPTKIAFSGKSTTKKVTYAIEFEFFDEIDPGESKINHSGRGLELVLRKKESKEEYWPRLLKDKAKMHWLQTDWDKWVDEDEQDPNADDDFMAKAGGMGGMGEGGFEGIDFSKFGSGPGGPAGGMPDFGEDEEGDEEEDNDEELPALEGEEDAAVKPTTASKIEEVE